MIETFSFLIHYGNVNFLTSNRFYVPFRLKKIHKQLGAVQNYLRASSLLHSAIHLIQNRIKSLRIDLGTCFADQTLLNCSNYQLCKMAMVRNIQKQFIAFVVQLIEKSLY